MNTFDIKSYLKRTDGKNAVKDMLRETSIFRLAGLVIGSGLSKKGLEIVREGANLHFLNKLKREFSQYINSIKNQTEVEYETSSVKRNSTVWILWFQGEDAQPPVVERCIRSVRENLPEYNVVLLDETTYQNYICLPEHIKQKYDRGIISKTHLSDLIRLELLTSYGGTWMDATVFLTSTPPSYVMNSDLFLFQTLKPGVDGHATCISSWFITAQAPSRILMMTKHLLYEYWERYDIERNYFIIHFFMQIAIENYPEEWSKVIPCSNETPHILQLVLEELFDQKMFDGICSQTSIHKMTYKTNSPMQIGSYYNYLFMPEKR